MHEEEDPFTRQLIGFAIDVHRQLGPGLMESTYERAFCVELDEHGVPYSQQLRVPVFYKGHLIGEYRPDLASAPLCVVGQWLSPLL